MGSEKNENLQKYNKNGLLILLKSLFILLRSLLILLRSLFISLRSLFISLRSLLILLRSLQNSFCRLLFCVKNTFFQKFFPKKCCVYIFFIIFAPTTVN